MCGQFKVVKRTPFGRGGVTRYPSLSIRLLLLQENWIFFAKNPVTAAEIRQTLLAAACCRWKRDSSCFRGKKETAAAAGFPGETAAVEAIFVALIAIIIIIIIIIIPVQFSAMHCCICFSPSTIAILLILFLQEQNRIVQHLNLLQLQLSKLI